MACEEEVFKIAKKLDKMVANGAQVSYYFVNITVFY